MKTKFKILAVSLAAPVMMFTMLGVPAGTLGVFGPAKAAAACGSWEQISPNRIVSYNYNCTYYFDSNGWYVILNYDGASGRAWLLGRDGT